MDNGSFGFTVIWKTAVAEWLESSPWSDHATLCTAKCNPRSSPRKTLYNHHLFLQSSHMNPKGRKPLTSNLKVLFFDHFYDHLYLLFHINNNLYYTLNLRWTLNTWTIHLPTSDPKGWPVVPCKLEPWIFHLW